MPASKTKPQGPAAVVRDYAVMLAGSIVYAMSMVMFLRPAEIPVGGLTGLAMISNFFWGWPLGVQTIILNIPLFLWSWRELGRSFVIRSGAAMLMTSILMDVFQLFVPAYTGDRLLSALFGGALHGIGMGIIFSRGGTTGGTDIISKIVSLRTGRTVGNIMLLLNGIIICAASFAYANGSPSIALETILYSIVMQTIASFAIDTMLGGMDSGNAAFIITDRPEEISQAVFARLGRGVTAMNAEGMFSKTPRTTLLCAIRSHELLSLKRVVAAADPHAFMILTNAREVVGNGFNAIPEQIRNGGKDQKNHLKEGKNNNDQ